MIKKLLLILTFFIMLMPVYFMVVMSFQDISGVVKMPPDLIPNNATMMNYIRLLDSPLLRWLINTILIVLSGTLLSVLLSSMAAYSFAFFQFPYKKILWAILLVGIMIPRISLVIPSYVVIKKMGLSGTMWAVILSVAYSPGNLYLARVYFETVPKSLLESARLDGANEFQILYKIVMPMSKPIITSLSLFTAIGYLGDYLWQMLVLQSPERQTLLVGLIKSSQALGNTIMTGMNPLGYRMAVGVALLFPLLVIFLIANKYFIQDIGGAEKG
jgi:ABC-type glycerol-3-phosphate transport system permease component